MPTFPYPPPRQAGLAQLTVLLPVGDVTNTITSAYAAVKASSIKADRINVTLLVLFIDSSSTPVRESTRDRLASP
jgi:hypothetical protein